MSRREYDIIGVMSGSSLDALDLAWVKFRVVDDTIVDWQLCGTRSTTLNQAWRTRLQSLPSAAVREILQTDAELGAFIGQECKSLITNLNETPDAIASHGHTILHHPEHGYTLQIGNPSAIAENAHVPVISDFRSRDIAAGGKGAPLAPIVEQYLFPGRNFYLNLGGIANLTYFNNDGIAKAWDIAPANQLLNYLSGKVDLPFDKDGAIARSGQVNSDLLRQLSNIVELPLTRPYTLDNSWVRQTVIPILEASNCEVPDLLATTTEFIAQSVSAQAIGCCHTPGDIRLFITGGGAKNSALVDAIRQKISPGVVELPDQTVIDFKEAILMALCGMLRLLGKPNALASVTGAKYDTVNGMITYGTP